MVKEALFVRMEAKPGKEQAVESFLKEALPDVQAERGTEAWFAIRMVHRRSRSSTPSRTSPAGRRTSPAGSRPR